MITEITMEIYMHDITSNYMVEKNYSRHYQCECNISMWGHVAPWLFL